MYRDNLFVVIGREVPDNKIKTVPVDTWIFFMTEMKPQHWPDGWTDPEPTLRVCVIHYFFEFL